MEPTCRESRLLSALPDARSDICSSCPTPDLATSGPFGSTLPLVNFAGPVLGSGLTLLEPDATIGVDKVQRKCCGFVQLSTCIGTGMAHSTPRSRSHGFLVFVLFPIHEMPWPIRCKRMMDRTSQFQPGTLFSCGAGTIVGRLNHSTMKTPPTGDRDILFSSWCRTTGTPAPAVPPRPHQPATCQWASRWRLWSMMTRPFSKYVAAQLEQAAAARAVAACVCSSNYPYLSGSFRSAGSSVVAAGTARTSVASTAATSSGFQLCR